MARHKNSTALFDVFHGQKPGEARANDPLRQPRWWLKKSDEAAEAPVEVDPNDPTTAPIKSPLIARRTATAPQAAVVATSSPASTPARAGSGTRLASASRDAVDPTRGRTAARSEAARSQPIEFDSARREVHIRASLPVAVASAFGIFCVIGLAYVLGQHEAPSGEIASTETVPMQAIEAPHKPLLPSAVDTSRSAGVFHAADANSTPTRAVPAVHREAALTTPMANSADGMHVDMIPAGGYGPRTIGLNYVIAQSYPSHQTAAEARDYLVQNGIPCTVEHAPAGWAGSNWFSVVTVQGFEHIHTEECDNFKQEITRLGDQFAGTARIKRFEPALFRWK